MEFFFEFALVLSLKEIKQYNISNEVNGFVIIKFSLKYSSHDIQVDEIYLIDSNWEKLRSREGAGGSYTTL